ncbi:hypothetical protein AGMMS50262_15810 [Bacteroidia bacterium]|nr:hypothetical protein AGMMS50262_15810 [Bacteroidia bacterium]
MSLTTLQAQGFKISFNETTHDFGVIEEKGGKVSFDFIVTNEGNEPLVISNVKASCGCTTPSWTQSPIEPGKTGKITATYNPQGRPGRFNKSITVTTNASPAPYTLYIKGEVNRPDANPETTYPVRQGNLLYKRTPDLDFGNVTPDGTKKITIEAYNQSGTAFTPSPVGLPPYITVTGNIPPQKAGNLEFTLNAPLIKKYGKVGGSFTLTADAPIGISYKADIQDNYDNLTADQKKNAGKINVNAQPLVFSKKVNTQVLKVANSGKSDLHVKAIQTSTPDITFSKSVFVVKSREIVEVKVTYPVQKLKTVDNQAVISIFSDDPKNPQKDINVTVNP